MLLVSSNECKCCGYILLLNTFLPTYRWKIIYFGHIVDCPHPTCSGHGWCVNGTCICQKGWRSPDCSKMDDAALQCLPDCSGHGHFDLVGQQCECDPEWTGSECDKSKFCIFCKNV